MGWRPLKKIWYNVAKTTEEEYYALYFYRSETKPNRMALWDHYRITLCMNRKCLPHKLAVKYAFQPGMML